MSSEVIVDRVVSRVRTIDGAGGLSADTLRAIVDAILPAVAEMLEHRDQVGRETSTENGYADWLEGGERP